MAHHGEAGVLADVRPQLIEQRAIADPSELRVDLPDEGDGAAGAIDGDILRDRVQVVFDVERKLKAHQSASPAASAMA